METGNSKVLDITVTRTRIQQISNVVYEQVPMKGYDNIAMKMDILQPRQKGRIPAIVFVTGGQFIHANKDNYVQLRMDLAEAGYVVASIEYRPAPAGIFPEPLEDVKAAIRYLKAKADLFHIDPSRVGIIGESGGGYLASFAGTTNGMHQFDKGDHLDQTSEVKAVVDLYGLSDLSRVGYDFSPELRRLYESAGSAEALWINGIGAFGGLDGGVLAYPERTAAANPLTYISSSAPPFLLMHGERDQGVSPSQTEILHEALLKQGIESTRYIVRNATHGGSYWIQPELVKIIIDFFAKHLRKH